MCKTVPKFALAAGIALATAFTLSCFPEGGYEGGGQDGGNLFSYCLISGQCLSGSFTSKECSDYLGGLPSNICIAGVSSSSALPSSSSVVPSSSSVVLSSSSSPISSSSSVANISGYCLSGGTCVNTTQTACNSAGLDFYTTQSACEAAVTAAGHGYCLFAGSCYSMTRDVCNSSYVNYGSTFHTTQSACEAANGNPGSCRIFNNVTTHTCVNGTKSLCDYYAYTYSSNNLNYTVTFSTTPCS